MIRQRPKQFHQGLRVYELDKVAIKLGFMGALFDRFLPAASNRDQHDAIERCVLPQSLCNFIAVESWQADVQEHYVRSKLESDYNGTDPIISHSCIMTCCLQQQSEGLSRIHIVIHHKNTQ